MLLVSAAIVWMPAAAQAAPNPGIVVGEVVVESAGGGQATVGDTLAVSGSWDASSANPQEGDTFTIGLPVELAFPQAVPFSLVGQDDGGNPVVWGNCLTDPATGIATCELTDEVTATPELVKGTWEFDVQAVLATDEEEVSFDLNGSDVLVELPGDGGIDDGIDPPAPWNKAGEMKSDQWSMGWTINLPGDRMVGHDTINIAEELSDNQQLCAPSNLKVESVRGSTVVDVTDIATMTAGADPQHFTFTLTEPDAGWDPGATYRITYDTCTPDGLIDPEGTVYENEATIDVWGESSGVIGVEQDWSLTDTINKTGNVLGGGERNGKISWTVTVAGDHLVGKDVVSFAETLSGDHEVCADTISGIRVYERYGPSNSLQTEVTDQLEIIEVSSSEQEFAVEISPIGGFEFRASDWNYLIVYTTCATTDGLPEGGTVFSNVASVDGQTDGSDATVPGRTDQKRGAINTSAVTVDGVSYMPQTTLNWAITVPGENLTAIDSALTVTDTLSATQAICVGSDGSIPQRMNLRVEARDQIQGGGLATVDLSSSATASLSGQDITITIPQPTLPQPGGGSAVGFSHEYQYVITYTTCTATGGMDAPGTTYGNDAEVAGVSYTHSFSQNNRGSGTGQGVTRGSVSVNKVLADTTGAQFVPEGTEFTVHVEEIDPSGTTQVEYDLQVPAGGDPTDGLNARGTGWTIALSEPAFPAIPGVVFGDPVFTETPGVTVSEDGTTAIAALDPGTNVSVTLTNTAQLGALEILKEVEGPAAGLVDAELEYEITASIDVSELGSGFPAQPDRVFTLTAGEPYTLGDLPIGSTVTFSEAMPVDDDVLTWTGAVIDPETIEVLPAHATAPGQITVTNSVERTVGTFSVAKTVTGAEADNAAVPAEVTVTASWTEEGGDLQSKQLTLPTDGSAVPLDENLLIGTEVTLTETPLEDGSGIAWGAPVWSGTGVALDGASAVVTIGRDASAAVALENPAATSTAGISLIKGIAGEAASEVDPGTEFPVTATWTDADGEQSTQLMINAVTPTALGEDLPAGTVVTITEGTRPFIETVEWGSITISGDDVTDGGDGSAEIIVSDQQSDVTLVTVTNEATLAVGTFSLAKTVTGAEADNAAVPDGVTVTATWTDGSGAPQSKQLTLPTDGSAVPLDENLLIGTEVTLTETPLEDGSGIAWGAPVWSGTGVTVDGESAVVRVGRDAAAAVALENHAATSTAGISLIKGIAGEAAGEVDPGTEFPVTATWTDADGEQSTQLMINAVTPTALGEDLPAGTVVTITEGTSPVIETVEWGSVTISGDDVTDGGDGSAEIIVSDQQGDATLVTVVNEATWAQGTFSLTKDLGGVLAAHPGVDDSVIVTATWLDEDLVLQSKELTLPIDGSVVAFGETLPHGTRVTLSEVTPPSAPSFTWGTPQWSGDGIEILDGGSAVVTIAAAQSPELRLTNLAVASTGSLELTKTLSGAGAADIPADTVFPVTVSWTDLLGDEQSFGFELVVGESVSIPVPVGTDVRIVEEDADLPGNVTWSGAQWHAGGDNVTVTAEDNGSVATVVVTGESGADASLTLENVFDEVPDLVESGGSLIPAVIGAAIALVLLSAGAVLLLLRRRRNA